MIIPANKKANLIYNSMLYHCNNIDMAKILSIEICYIIIASIKEEMQGWLDSDIIYYYENVISQIKNIQPNKLESC